MTNKYFNLYNANNEQNLIQDLITEAISIYGIECYYIPRKCDNINELYMEDPLAYFDEHYALDCYLKTYDKFGGNGDIFSKFGISNTDQATFTISRYTFNKAVHRKYMRPNEGDLLYFPMSSAAGFFEIKYVNDESVFFQLGEFYIFDLQCERYRFQGNDVHTDIPVIDDLANEQQHHIVLKLSDQFNKNDFIENEAIYQGDSINNAIASAKVFSFDITDKNADNQNVYIFDAAHSDTTEDEYYYNFDSGTPYTNSLILVNGVHSSNLIDITNSLHSDLLTNYITLEETPGGPFNTYLEYCNTIDNIIDTAKYPINNAITITPNTLFDIELDIINNTDNFKDNTNICGINSDAVYKVAMPMKTIIQNTGKVIQVKEEPKISHDNNAGNNYLTDAANIITDFDENNPFAE